MNLAIKTADTAISYHPPKILVVDDELRMCDSLEVLLSGEGYEVHTGTSGKEAIEHIAKNGFDLVLLDIVMPEMDGHEVMRFIDSQAPDTLVILITGHASVDSAIEALRGGAYDYLRKPFEPEELLRTVRSALDEQRLKSERKQVEEGLKESTRRLEVAYDQSVIYAKELTEEIKERERAEEALQKARDELERRVEERTAELVSATEQLKLELTERKRAEEQIRRLSHELLVAQESEQQRISRELHDVLGQELSALKIGLDTFFDNQPGATPETRQRLSEFSKMLKGTIASVRDLSRTLRSTGLDQRGLISTVRLYCKEFSRSRRPKVDFLATGIDESRLNFDVKINLYRIIQEGLTNAKKHADANHVTIRLLESFPNIILCIEDDGTGFDVRDRLISAANEKRMGLRIMEERVALLNGKMEIESRPNQGTKILVEVPYKGKRIG